MSNENDESDLSPPPRAFTDEGRGEREGKSRVPEAVDLSALSPGTDGPEAFASDVLVSSIVEQAELLEAQDLSPLSAFDTSEDALVASVLEQAELLEAQDLSPLAPFASSKEALVASLVEQAELLGAQDLSALSPLSLREDLASSVVERAELLVTPGELPAPAPQEPEGEGLFLATSSKEDFGSVASPLVELAPRAIALAGCLAAAAWLLVWFAPPQTVEEEPELSLITWTESGEAPNGVGGW